MKKIFTCLLLFVFASVGNGQNYKPMLQADACWVRKYVDNISLPPITESRETYFIFSNNVELINEEEYIPLFMAFDSVGEDSLIGYLREDIETQQVFYLNANENLPWLNCEGEEILLYDFTAEVGDTVYHCPNSDLYYVVQSVEFIEEYMNPEIDFFDFGGGRVYEVYSSEFNFSSIYEGVGSNIGPIHEPPNVSVPGIEILESYIYGCEFILDIDKIMNTEVEVFPNPVQTTLHIKMGGKAKLSKVKIYDVSQRVQMTFGDIGGDFSINTVNLMNGLYFIMGYDENGRQIFNQKFIKMN